MTTPNLNPRDAEKIARSWHIAALLLYSIVAGVIYEAVTGKGWTSR